MKALEILQKAKKEGYAVGAFNMSSIETLKAVTQAALKLKSPIILEASDGEVNYIGIKELVALVNLSREDSGLPIILNLDHGKDFETCKKAIEAGFDYVHIDTSKLPLEENVAIAKEVVKLAHFRGVLVEGEMDHIEGSSEDHTKEDPTMYQKAGMYTDPQKARDFVERTGIDVFASFIGNLHGVYANEKHLDLELLHKIRQALPNTFLSLHGGSGINENDIRRAVANNIVKVNVNSELRIAYKMSLQESLNSSNEVALYKLTPPAIKAVQEVVERKIRLFGSVGKA
ncbi:MAG: class II fructose-bisphosphate aldolase [Patescibacteria group bacterium]